MKSLIMGMHSFRQIVQFEMVFKPANQLRMILLFRILSFINP